MDYDGFSVLKIRFKKSYAFSSYRIGKLTQTKKARRQTKLRHGQLVPYNYNMIEITTVDGNYYSVYKMEINSVSVR